MFPTEKLCLSEVKGVENITFINFFLSAIEEKVVRYYEKRQRPSLKGCYVKRDRKVYPVGAVWYPYVQPFGYMRCHACTCLVSGYLHNHMRL